MRRNTKRRKTKEINERGRINIEQSINKIIHMIYRSLKVIYVDAHENFMFRTNNTYLDIPFSLLCPVPVLTALVSASLRPIMMSVY